MIVVCHTNVYGSETKTAWKLLGFRNDRNEEVVDERQPSRFSSTSCRASRVFREGRIAHQLYLVCDLIVLKMLLINSHVGVES